nr:PEPxxWA-CTERM sorting domain-containing protein [Sandarakinorhabdus sp.]
MKFAYSALVGAVILSSAAVQAAPSLSYESSNMAGPARNVASGSNKGMSWSAWNNLIAMTSTGTIASGGNPAFLAPRAQYNGVVSLIMTYSGGSFICSGTLLPDRVSIVTAAHCVSDGAGTAGPILTRAFFSNSPDLDAINHIDPASSVRVANRILVNPGYSGEVIDENDLAIIRLVNAAPDWAKSYDIDFAGGLDGQQFNVAGYGGRSTIGGSFGVNAGTGRIRQGDNTFDYAWGNSEFAGFFTDLDANGRGFFGFADYSRSIVSDFDSGLAANDMSCNIAAAVGATPGFACNTGVGAREVGVAGGDSGGPQFINGKIVSVTSYGLSFGTGFGDCRAGLNSSCGEYSGYVPLSIHEDFVNFAVGVPEPASWAMLIAGFGMVGAAMRRRKAVLAA